MKKGFIIAFLLLIFSQYAIAQITTADIREQIAKGECETAQSLYNVYKAMNGANKAIEREIADCITGSSSSHGGTGIANGHEWVDLGLPSGTLWATCNVGANKPEDYGSYFAWSETQLKDTYNWATYQYCMGKYNTMTKYCNNSGYGYNGFTDNLTTLQDQDDPTTLWGGNWHMPSKAQWDELLANTTNEWTKQNGVEGWLFTSKKSTQSLFLPAAGYRSDGNLYNVGSNGYYWSSSLGEYSPNSAWNLNFYSGHCFMSSYNRYSGQSVRAVLPAHR